MSQGKSQIKLFPEGTITRGGAQAALQLLSERARYFLEAGQGKSQNFQRYSVLETNGSGQVVAQV